MFCGRLPAPPTQELLCSYRQPAAILRLTDFLGASCDAPTLHSPWRTSIGVATGSGKASRVGTLSRLDCQGTTKPLRTRTCDLILRKDATCQQYQVHEKPTRWINKGQKMMSCNLLPDQTPSESAPRPFWEEMFHKAVEELKGSRNEPQRLVDTPNSIRNLPGGPRL